MSEGNKKKGHRIILSLVKSKEGESFKGKITFGNETFTFFLAAKNGLPVMYTAQNSEKTPLIYLQSFVFDNTTSTINKFQ